MLFLIMLFAIFTDQFGRGLFACFFLLVACVAIDVFAFFVWSAFIVFSVSSIF